MDIKDHPAITQCNGKILCQLIAGSTLYGLNNEQSDVDYRGLFLATDKKYITGFDIIESIVQTGEIDSTYYELSRYLKLLRKSNTQVLEILFADPDKFISSSQIFEEIRTNRYKLIDTHVLKASLRGYVYSEIRLATGERSGQLGGKRKLAVERFGYSPKNFTQIFRLCEVGNLFFRTGEYMVNVKAHNPDKHDFLMEIKNHPENFTCEQLSKMVDIEFEKLVKVMEESKINFKFDVELASDLVLKAREIYK